MLLDERRAIQQMSSAVKIGIGYRNLSEAGVALTVEPFFRCVIAAVYYDRLQSLLTKARIRLPVSKARLMMGVMDESGTLQYGQVLIIRIIVIRLLEIINN
jgi:RNA-dependent RNA polymerase